MKLRLKEVRNESGLTRRVVSAAVGITEATLFNYEQGNTLPTVDVAYRLADFYGVSTDFILGRETPKEAPRGGTQ